MQWKVGKGYAMSCPVMSCQVMSRHAMSCHVISSLSVLPALPLMAVSAASLVDSSPLVASCARGEEKADSRDCTDARPSCLREAEAVASEVPSPVVMDVADDDDDEATVAVVLVLVAQGVKRVARAVHAAHCTAGRAVSPRPLDNDRRQDGSQWSVSVGRF